MMLIALERLPSTAIVIRQRYVLVIMPITKMTISSTAVTLMVDIDMRPLTLLSIPVAVNSFMPCDM